MGLCSSTLAFPSVVKLDIFNERDLDLYSVNTNCQYEGLCHDSKVCQDEESLDQLFQNHQGGLAALDLLDL